MNGMFCTIEGYRAFALSGRIPDHLHTQGDALGWSLVGLSGRTRQVTRQATPQVTPTSYPHKLPPQVTPTSNDKPRHPRQKYLLTVKGTLLYNELTMK